MKITHFYLTVSLSLLVSHYLYELVYIEDFIRPQTHSYHSITFDESKYF